MRFLLRESAAWLETLVYQDSKESLGQDIKTSQAQKRRFRTFRILPVTSNEGLKF